MRAYYGGRKGESTNTLSDELSELTYVYPSITLQLIARRSEIRAHAKYLHKLLGTLPTNTAKTAAALSSAQTLSIRTDGRRTGWHPNLVRVCRCYFSARYYPVAHEVSQTHAHVRTLPLTHAAAQMEQMLTARAMSFPFAMNTYQPFQKAQST